MKSRRFRRFALLAFASLFIPPLLWLGVVLVAPTNWAKSRVVAALEAGTRRSVRLERLSARLLGGFQLTNLEIGSPQTTDSPWFRASAVRVEFRWRDLLRGDLQPRMVEIDGIDMRVLRRGDGSLELADLIIPEYQSNDHWHAHPGSAPLPVRIHGGSVTVIDEPSQTRLHLEGVEGDGTREERRIVVNGLRGLLNGGPFQFTGELDRRHGVPTFEARFRADDVVLDDGMSVLRYVIPVLAGAPLNLKGHLDCDLKISGQGANWTAVSESLAGHGVIGINPVDLDGAPLIAELSKVAELSRQGRGASIRSDFAIKNHHRPFRPQYRSRAHDPLGMDRLRRSYRLPDQPESTRRPHSGQCPTTAGRAQCRCEYAHGVDSARHHQPDGRSAQRRLTRPQPAPEIRIQEGRSG
jgi:uncharacterized protein involved in outer membrane biogenesis